MNMRAHFSPRFLKSPFYCIREAESGILVAVRVQHAIRHCDCAQNVSDSVDNFHIFICCVYPMLFLKHLLSVCCAAWTINHHIYELSGCVLTAYAQLLIIISAGAPSFRQRCADEEVHVSCPNILNRAVPQYHNRFTCAGILMKPVNGDCFHWNHVITENMWIHASARWWFSCQPPNRDVVALNAC